jgi:ATP-dependent Clp protease ATP-binding subunit ClpC
MFERFTDRARRVVVLAQENARMLNHAYIGTEHLLLGLIHEGEGVAAVVLHDLGIDLDKVRANVEEIVGQGQQITTGHIPFTPRAKTVLDLCLREALQLGHNYIGTEHILMGLIREGEGVAAQILVKEGLELPRVRQAIIKKLTGYQHPSPSSNLPPHPEKVSATTTGSIPMSQIVGTPTHAPAPPKLAVDSLTKALTALQDALDWLAVYQQERKDI